jgi:hypothetical protein
MGMFSAIAGIFSSSKVGDTAVDFVRKIGGLDELTVKERLDAALAWMKETKHQSPVRRFIALAFVLGFMLFTFAWLVSTILFRIGSIFSWGTPELLVQFGLLSSDILSMLQLVLLQPVNLVIGFYFILGASPLKGKN